MYNTLTRKQKTITQMRGKVIVKACPGSGKTFMIATKVANQILNWKEKNKGIAVFTFTNVAKDELVNNIEKILGYNVTYPHFIGTLDGFISQYIYMPFGHLIMKCKEKPSLLSDFSLGALNYAQKIWRKECYNNFCVPLDFFINEKLELCHHNISKFEKCKIESKKPCNQYKNYCLSRGYATYDDITSISLAILQRNPQIQTSITKKFPIMIMDEAQDTSGLQMQLIDCLCEKNINLFLIVGDPDQAIYEWRDAEPSIFNNKYTDSEWSSCLLNENFRCSQKICDATKAFSKLTEASKAIGESATYIFQPQIVKYNVNSRDKIINYFLDICKSNNISISPEKVAILVRGNGDLNNKDYSNISNLWQNKLTKTLSYATYQKHIGKTSVVMQNVEIGIYNALIDNNANDVDLITAYKYFTPKIWHEIICRICKNIPPATIKLEDWVRKMEKLLNDLKSIYDFNESAEYNIKVKSRDNKLKDFKSQPMEWFFAKKYISDYLLTTIHSVKGRTFDAVLMIIKTNGKLTSNLLNNSDVESEPVRTGYVGMTRARKILMIAIPDTIKNSTLKRFDPSNWDLIESIPFMENNKIP